MVAVRPSVKTNFKSYQKQFHQALEEEIKELRRSGGSMTPISDGHHLGSRYGEHLYSFTSDYEIRFPEDAPIDLHVQKNKYAGTIVSVEGFDLLIAIGENIGSSIKKAKLNTEPWFLLKELQKRLGIAAISNTANRTLAEALLTSNATSTPISNDKFDDYAPRIVSEADINLQYNEHQAGAVNHILQHSVSFIWGPPGTGKTSTLGLAVASLVHSGQSVLVLAHSNAAVDTAIQSAGKYLCKSSYYNAGMVLRFGIPSNASTYQLYPMLNARGIVKEQQPELVESIEALEKQRELLIKESRQSGLTAFKKESIKEQISQIRKQLSPLKKEMKGHESTLISKGMVVGCTLSKATIAKEIFERKFDAVIIDEASMAYIPHCAYGATLAEKRIAIFGDFRQLAPVAQADSDTAIEWLQRDIFEEAAIIRSVARNNSDPRLVLLKTQYRMHPNISAIPNELFYNNQLEDSSGVKERTQQIVNLVPHQGNALVFYDLSRTLAFCCRQDHKSRFNVVSALIAADIAYRTQLSGTESIGLITPYSAQARLLHRILRETGQTKAKAATVHRFQGSEQNVIVFDAVDSYPQPQAGKLLQGGPQSTAARLANVAISRAEGKFIGLFNDDFIKARLNSFNVFRKFSHRLFSKSKVIPVSFTSSGTTVAWDFALPNVTAYPNAKAAQAEIHADFQSAQQAIAIDWPGPLRPSQHFQLKVNKGVQLLVRGPEANAIAGRIPNRKVWSNKSFSNMGIVGIDSQVLWIYTGPNASDKTPVFRIALPKTVTLLYDFLEVTPSDSGRSIEKAIRQDKSPFGSCELCRSPLWPQPGKYGFPRVECPKHPRQGRNLSTIDATRYAQFMNCVCPECHSSMNGVKNSSTGKVFLSCSQSGCQGARSLRDLI